eukprot:GDKJ01022993.1.p1 GENE.GDKJ01022993.1~~GDKJ01022993.1.p1  ORF type:complete len:736 (-),score=224.47 GDKJ01022993.1:50-1975(-)
MELNQQNVTFVSQLSQDLLPCEAGALASPDEIGDVLKFLEADVTFVERLLEKHAAPEDEGDGVRDSTGTSFNSYADATPCTMNLDASPAANGNVLSRSSTSQKFLDPLFTSLMRKFLTNSNELLKSIRRLLDEGKQLGARVIKRLGSVSETAVGPMQALTLLGKRVGETLKKIKALEVAERKRKEKEEEERKKADAKQKKLEALTAANKNLLLDIEDINTSSSSSSISSSLESVKPSSISSSISESSPTSSSTSSLSATTLSSSSSPSSPTGAFVNKNDGRTSTGATPARDGVWRVSSSVARRLSNNGEEDELNSDDAASIVSDLSQSHAPVDKSKSRSSLLERRHGNVELTLDVSSRHNALPNDRPAFVPVSLSSNFIPISASVPQSPADATYINSGVPYQSPSFRNSERQSHGGVIPLPPPPSAFSSERYANLPQRNVPSLGGYNQPSHHHHHHSAHNIPVGNIYASSNTSPAAPHKNFLRQGQGTANMQHVYKEMQQNSNPPGNNHTYGLLQHPPAGTIHNYGSTFAYPPPTTYGQLHSPLLHAPSNLPGASYNAYPSHHESLIRPPMPVPVLGGAGGGTFVTPSTYGGSYTQMVLDGNRNMGSRTVGGYVPLGTSARQSSLYNNMPPSSQDGLRRRK